MRSLVLDRPDVVRHLDALSLMASLRDGFLAQSRFGVAEGEVDHVHFPGHPPELPAYARFAEGALPGGDGRTVPLVQLFEADSHRLLAVLEATQLNAITSAVSCAIAADTLARPDAERVAIIGAGAHAGAQLKSLRLVRSLQHVRVFDVDLPRMASFAERMYRAVSLPVRMAENVEEAVADADIVVAVTDAGEPFLFPGMVRAGCHVTSVGLDLPGHRELSAGLIRQSTFFCDDRRRALAPDALPVLQLGEDTVAAELADVIAGRHPGRTSREEITLFAAYGLPYQVLAAAWHVFLGAREDEDIQSFELDASGRLPV